MNTDYKVSKIQIETYLKLLQVYPEVGIKLNKKPSISEAINFVIDYYLEKNKKR